MRSVAMEELAAATSPRRMSQSELAGELGMTPQVVSKWVNGLGPRSASFPGSDEENRRQEA
jgi:transcriptional regulator with XRE-family HTH domain